MSNKNIDGLDKLYCTGCGLCINVCPYSAIELLADSEGFDIPVVDSKVCVECGNCSRKCPSINPLEKRYPYESKLCISKDPLLDNSASGGFFITIARYFIEELKGVVYGVVLDQDYNCKHAEAISVEDLIPMQNSKYIQSRVGNCYKKAKERLEDGKYVLFTGTPCQIAALKSYLKKDYLTLLTIDVVCHGVPSQLLFRKYLSKMFKFDKVKSYTFRNRLNKHTYNPSVKEPKRSTYEASVVTERYKIKISRNKDPYYYSFVTNESFRESCYTCQYACNNRVSDITMGDCDSEKLYPTFFPYESKSIVLLNTTIGGQWWDKIKDYFEYTGLNYEEEYKVNTPLREPSYRGKKRSYIYKDLQNLPWPIFKYKYTEHHTARQIVGLALFKIKTLWRKIRKG